MATKNQISFIHVIKSKMALPDDDYRSLLAQFDNATSSKDLCVTDAIEFTELMLKMAHQKGVEIEDRSVALVKKSDIIAHLQSLGSRPGMATQKQLVMIVMMWWNKSRMTTDKERFSALNHLLRNKFAIERIEWVPIELVRKIVAQISSIKGESDHG